MGVGFTAVVLSECRRFDAAAAVKPRCRVPVIVWDSSARRSRPGRELATSARRSQCASGGRVLGGEVLDTNKTYDFDLSSVEATR